MALKSSIKNAIIIKQTTKPEFDTSSILEVSDLHYTDFQMDTARFISSYYFSSLSEALALFVPFEQKIVIPANTKANEEATIIPAKSRACEQKIVIPAKAGIQQFNLVAQPDKHYHVELPTLTVEQQNALTEILKHKRSLLFGVTGAGKTEIFIHLMADALSNGKNVIMLMPEIALTPQMHKRLSSYFGDSIALWHSKLTKKQKEKILNGLNSGEIRIIAGARSALFVPMSNIGLIIVDEEHDDSYKSMMRPRYNAKDMAIYMSDKLDAKVLLASATPSIGSFYKYPIVRLKTPYIKTDKQYKFTNGDKINSQSIGLLKETLRAKNQAILFLPTRGNFKYLHCSSCGATHKCPFCSVGMTLHRDNRHLRCHYCGFSEAIQESCSQCGHSPLSSERIGTKEAIEVLHEAIPEANIAQFDKDSITTPTKLHKALNALSTKETDILVGTQMLSKGHDYADITLAIIMGLDYMIGMADFRAKERAVSMLFQIAGRSGRSKDATVLIQTNYKDVFSSYLSDYELFINDELEFRKISNYPPFCSIARIIISNKKDVDANETTRETLTRLKTYRDIEIIGHGKAPIERVANKYRYHIILRSKTKKALINALHEINNRAIEIDMDALDFS